MEQLVSTVQRVREDAERKGRTLDRVYVLSNGDTRWLQELKVALTKMGGWKNVGASRDVVLSPEGKYVAQTMDMMIATRAEVFVGNAVSKLISLDLVWITD